MAPPPLSWNKTSDVKLSAVKRQQPSPSGAGATKVSEPKSGELTAEVKLRRSSPGKKLSRDSPILKGAFPEVKLGSETKDVGVKPITVTINVPSPSASVEGQTPYLSVVGKEELLSSLAPSGAFEPLIGDVKLTLDDLKGSLMNYYSQLYAAEGPSISERLDFLQQHFYPSAYPISGARHSSAALPGETHLSTSLAERLVKPKGGTIPALLPGVLPQKFGISRESHLAPNLLGALYPVKGPRPEALMQDRLAHGGLAMSKRPQGVENISLEPEGLHELAPTRPKGISYSPTANISPRHSIGELVSEIRRDTDLATRRLIGMTDTMIRETDDPNKRAFSYTNFPRIRRRPHFGTQHEMQDAMLCLYNDLHSQVNWNDRRIRGLRHRMSLLHMNTVGSMNDMRTDPRLAY